MCNSKGPDTFFFFVFHRRSYFEVFWYTHHLFVIFFIGCIFHAFGWVPPCFSLNLIRNKTTVKSLKTLPNTYNLVLHCRGMVRSQSNIVQHKPEDCKDLYAQWNNTTTCPTPTFAPGEPMVSIGRSCASSFSLFLVIFSRHNSLNVNGSGGGKVRFHGWDSTPTSPFWPTFGQEAKIAFLMLEQRKPPTLLLVLW